MPGTARDEEGHERSAKTLAVGGGIEQNPGMVHPIYVMAAVTTVVAFVVGGSLLWQMSPADRRRWLCAMLAFGCLMSPAAYYAVRRPLLIGPLEPMLSQPGWDAGGWSALRDAVRLGYAPLTEEPA